jgi:extracellular factor (EF) 3-hydroxypalmitic acid methyl ester biosynthesis protein
MQDLMVYQGVAIRERSGLVREKPGPSIGQFEREIEDYLERLRDFEARCTRPGADQAMLLREITMLTDAMLEECAQFERKVKDPLMLKKAQVDFRERTHPVLSKSYCINRTRTWPNGQQGDFMTLELAYKNMPLSEGIGYYLDKYLLSTTLGVGVRERVVKLRDLLKKELTRKPGLKVLDIACGSCREVFELAPEIKSSGAKFTCIDLDANALDFALDRFAYAGLTSDHADVVQYNALRMFDSEMAQAEFGMQDIIYSIGFFDYLPDDFLVKMLNSLYALLTPGGKLIAAFKDADRYRPELFHWLVDWDGFLQRREKDFERLLREAGIPVEAVTMTRVDSGPIVFYTAEKK